MSDGRRAGPPAGAAVGRVFRAARRAVREAGVGDQPPWYGGGARLNSGEPRPVRALEPSWLSGRIGAAARRLSDGETTALELARAALRSAETHAELGALAACDGEAALTAASALDAELAESGARSPLHGIPVTLKDNIDVAGLPTTGGSAAYRRAPSQDAWVAARLRGLGANVIGKAVCHEFGLGVTTPQARNPLDPERVPGGSSGGSAIAVATGIGLASVGTDTRGSVRVPAALCGVAGFKPTLGSIPLNGVIPLSWTMDSIGTLAASGADAVLTAMLLMPPAPPLGAPDSVRVGIARGAFDDLDREVEIGFRTGVELLGRSADICELAWPDDEQRRLGDAAGLLISRCEASAFHARAGTDRNRCWPETRDQLDAADQVRAHELVAAFRVRSLLEAQVRPLIEAVDVLVTPTTPVVAPLRSDPRAQLTRLSRETVLWSLLGYPCLTIPIRRGLGRLPVGVQFVGRPGRDADVAAIGLDFEAKVGAWRFAVEHDGINR